MRRLQLLVLLLCRLRVSGARQPGFSIHHDLLAHPQFEVVFAESFISEPEARALIEKKTVPESAPHPSYEAEFSSQTDLTSNIRSGDADNDDASRGGETDDEDGANHKVAETYEVMTLHPHRYLCAIPVIEPPPALNETATELAKAEEARELARASAHGWDLMNGLDGTCLYYVSGWWSYSFCYGHDVVQFHALPGSLKSGMPVRDPQTMEFVLGRAQGARPRGGGRGGNNNNNNNNNVDSGQGESSTGVTAPPPNTELQVKGDQRYLVQRLEAGTVCDLTGRDRTIEVQYHCSPGSTQDRIGWIKEVTTCAYLMVVHTPRLCSDVAFLPPKETRANVISCRAIVSEADEPAWHQRKTLEAEALMRGLDLDQSQGQGPAQGQSPSAGPMVVGGIVVGGRQILGNGEDGKMPIKLSPPRGFFAGGGRGGGIQGKNIAGLGLKTNNQQQQQQQQQAAGAGGAGETVEVVAQGRGRSRGRGRGRGGAETDHDENGEAYNDAYGEEDDGVDVLTDEELQELGLSPELVEQLQQQLQELAGERGWKLEVVEVPGDPREIRGVGEDDDDYDDDDDDENSENGGYREGGDGSRDGGGDSDGNGAGSQEKFFNEEL